jgi:nitrous oxidase accessory protein
MCSNRRAYGIWRIVLVAVWWLAFAHGLDAQERARTLVVAPNGPYTTLHAALAQAHDGDSIAVHGGTYIGPVIVSKRLRLEGHDWPVLDGEGHGTVVKIIAPDVVLSGFVIRRSGSSLDAENSGVAVEAPRAVIVGNQLHDTLFGIYLRKASDSVIRGNRIHGKDLLIPRRGDAIRVWYSNGVHLEDNRVTRSRDVVLWYSAGLSIRGNTVREGRYGLHFMYCDDTHIEANRLEHNSVGAFLMYSRRLRLHHNIIAHNRGPSGYGVGLKDLDDAVIEANVFLDNRVGAFVDNSPREIDSTGQFRDNVFAYNSMGLSLMPAVRRNWFSQNSFIDNQEQVNVAGGGTLYDNLWTVQEQGNYWSDYVGYDGDGDGRGDLPYRAERLFGDLLDRYPVLQVFVHSPVVQAIDFAARAFPLVQPQAKLTDTHPLMAPRLPPGLPSTPLPSCTPLAGASLGLLGLVAILLRVPRLAANRRSAWALLRGRRESSTFPAEPVESQTMPLIAVCHLSKRFKAALAINDVSFDIRAGEAVALWGPNGAGKTTILRCLLGLIPYSGTVHVAEHDVQRLGKVVRRLIGFVPQELHFHDDMSVYETMQFYRTLKHAQASCITPLLTRLELQTHAQKPVRSLSGGMKQRLALAVALLADPPLLLLDEPTANLDAQARNTLLHLLGELKAAGKTLVFSSHRVEEVLALADRVLMLEQGRLVHDASPRTLSQQAVWHTTLRLRVPGEQIEIALAALQASGFTASRNGTSVCVRVKPGEKGAPLQALTQARIAIHDFDLDDPQREAENHARYDQ